MAGSSANSQLVVCCKNHKAFMVRFKETDVQLHRRRCWASESGFVHVNGTAFAKVRAVIRKERGLRPGIKMGSWSPIFP